MIFRVLLGAIISIFINLYILKSFQNIFLNSKNKIYLNSFFIVCYYTIVILQISYIISLHYNFLSGIILTISVSTIAISFMLFFATTIFNIIIFPMKFIEFKKERRKFLKTTLNITFLILVFSYIIKGFFNGFKRPFINKVEIKIKNLKDDINFAVLSDIHLGKYLGKSFLELLIEDINKLDADALFIVGDMFDIKSNNIKDMIEPLKKLKIPAFFVLGNHEYYTGDALGLIKALKRYNVKVLENENIEFKGINLVGVYDRAGHRFGYLEPNLNKALKDKNKNLPTILLAHQPKYVYENVKNEVDLSICGHTHAGQIFPFSLLVMIDQKYVYGLYQEENRQIYVSSGAGFWGPPVRVLAPAEIALLQLRKA